MILALSLVVALTLLSARVIAQSGILLNVDDEAKKRKSVDFTQKFTLALFLPIGVIMVVLGFAFSNFGNNFISIGFAITLTAFSLVIQTESIKKQGDAAKSFGKKLRRIGWWFWWVSLIATLILLGVVLFKH